METIEIPVVLDAATGLKMFEVTWPIVHKYEEILEENKKELTLEQVAYEENLIKKFKKDLSRSGSYNFVQYWMNGRLKGES